MEDFIILHKIGVFDNHPAGPNIAQVSWNLPPNSWIKVNIDGSARGTPGHAGCGGIFRTCRGFIKGSFSYYLGINFAFESELMGFILAIEIAYNWNWYNL